MKVEMDVCSSVGMGLIDESCEALLDAVADACDGGSLVRLSICGGSGGDSLQG